MNRLKNRSSNTRGFSLIELIFAMFFLVIIILGVVSLQTSNLAIMNRQNNEIQAHFYANQALEITKVISGEITQSGHFGITGPEPDSKYELTDPIAEAENGSKIGATDFYRKIITDNTGISPAYKVTAVIYWEDGTGEHTVKAKRIIQ